jgi:sugar phosphate isomerase/epimerase
MKFMANRPAISRALGTMVAYGFVKGDVGVDLEIARRIDATCLEILPDWRNRPDPKSLRTRAADAGLWVHSAHGAWGGQAILSDRVDLGSTDASTWRNSVDDLKRCVDWLNEAGGRHLVVHPGGLSSADQFDARRDALIRGLVELADHAAGANTLICVENMPPGVQPGSRMADLFAVVVAIGRPEVRLCLDTGHANMVSGTAEETRAAGELLATTHVHDNSGSDRHEPPGSGTIDWNDWVESLDDIGYRGPIMLECIRHLRSQPSSITPEFLALLRSICSAVRPIG